MNRDVFYHKLRSIDRITDCVTALTNEDSGFYELCQKFADIALNAPKSFDGGRLSGVFQFDDIEIAKSATAEFIKTHNISNVNYLLDIIKKMHSTSVDDIDSRQKAGVVPSTEPGPVAGTYYVLSQIPDDVFEDIKKDILASK